MTDQTKEYDERAREMAVKVANLLSGTGLENTMEELLFVALKNAYADGIIDALRSRL